MVSTVMLPVSEGGLRQSRVEDARDAAIVRRARSVWTLNLGHHPEFTEPTETRNPPPRFTLRER
jgi:hypothetical protein